MDDPRRSGATPSVLRLYLLGGFRAECAGEMVPEGAWSRRSAKALVKLLATTPAHRLPRDQVLDLLWPDLSPESAASALRKALHFARHALEPALPPRGDSAYLLLHDDIIALAPDLV